MNDDLAARRRAKADARVARDCQASLDQVRQTAAIDHVAAQLLDSIRAHPSNRRPYDREGET
jgi:hypothetical protein